LVGYHPNGFLGLMTSVFCPCRIFMPPSALEPIAHLPGLLRAGLYVLKRAATMQGVPR
jgi:hypothetical protein